MDNFYEKYTKSLIIETIDILLSTQANTENIEGSDNQSSSAKILINFLKSKNIAEKFNQDSISDYILMLKILSVCLFIDNSKEIEKYLFAIFHIERKNVNSVYFKENLVFFVKEFNDYMKKEMNLTGIEISHNIYSSKNSQQMEIEGQTLNVIKTNLIVLFEEILDMLKDFGLKNKSLNKTSSQFIKYFFNLITMRNYFAGVCDAEVNLEKIEINKIVKKYNHLFLAFLFYNQFLDNAISLIDFLIDYIARINNNKLELAVKISNVYFNINNEDKDNLYNESLLEFGKKENLFKIFDIENFADINFLHIEENYYKLVNQRDICLFHYVNGYKLSYNQYVQKHFSHPENLNLFEKLKGIEIYQEMHDSIFFIPKLFKYLKTHLAKSNEINSSNLIKIENALLHKISKLSRLDSKFSYDLLSFKSENYIKKQPDYLKENNILNSNQINFDKNHNHKYSNLYNNSGLDLKIFKQSLLSFLNENLKELINKFSLNDGIPEENLDKIQAEQGENKNKIFRYEDWMKFYFENPYLTFLITYKFFTDYFVLEKVDNEKNNLYSKSNETNPSNFFNKLILPENYGFDSDQNEEEFNYFDIFENENLIVRMIEKIKSKFVLAELMRINLKLLFTQYAMLETDMINFSALMKINYSVEEINENIILYKCELMSLIWKIKMLFEKISDQNTIQSELDRVFSDIIVTDIEAFRIKVLKRFDKSLIKFLIEKIEPSCICEKYLDEMLRNKDPLLVINGLHLLGYWANCYPIMQVYDRVIREIELLKNMDLIKTIFTNTEKVYLFLEGLFLVSKAFPKKNEFLLDYFNFLKLNVENAVFEYDLLNESKLMIEKSIVFIKNFIIDSDYNNQNNNLFKLN